MPEADQATTSAENNRIARRSFLRLAGLMGASLPLTLNACARFIPTSPSGAAPATGVVGQSPTATPPVAGAQSRLPTQIPLQLVKPDLAPSSAGLQAGYLTYPNAPTRSVSDTPGSGGPVTALSVLLTTSPPPPPDQNPALQAINKELNVNLQLHLVANADYYTMVPTLIAGGDLPDLFYLDTTQLTIQGLPQFLKASYADLTPFLGGDAVKEYPNLAAFPSASWKQALYDGSIYGIPIVRPYFNWVWYINQTLLDGIGAGQPTSADDFKRILQEFTRPQSNQWGIAGIAPAFGLQTSGRGDSPQAAMFNVPNNWVVDANGTFTKDIETEQFRAALGYVRDLYSAGVFYPDATLSTTSLKTNFLAGKVGVISAGWNSYSSQLWDVALSLNPPMKVRTIHPFSSDGTKAIFHQGPSYIGIAAVKNQSPDRTRELLRILNYLAAPFGSQEFQAINFGVQNVDFNLDPKGNPVLTQQGQLDTNLGLAYLAAGVPVLYDRVDPDFVGVAYTDEQTMVPALLQDPSAGLYSSTDRTKGSTLATTFNDGLGDIIAGRSPLNGLDQLLNSWRTTGGDQIRQEYQQAYASSAR
jgi:putative aldouronate transport system substrate-binding protein